MKRLMFVAVLALVMLMAVTPVLASGSGSGSGSQNQEVGKTAEQPQSQAQNEGETQNQYQNQEVEKNQDPPQNQEQNEGETQNQEKNLQQSQHQEQNQHQLGEGGSDESVPTSALPGVQLFTLTGTIAALEEGTGPISIEVALHNGNRFIKRLVGEEPLLVLVTEGTEYRQYTGGTCIPAEWSDLSVGDTVHIKGTFSVDEAGNATFTATRVTVDVPCLPTPI